jgi:drug/metabolite transporter (DMT)-like permease
LFPSLKNVLIGLAFAFLWASASTAGKFGLRSAEPLFLFTIRFLIAGTMMLAYATFISRERFPKSTEWKPLAIFGLFNTTLYLGIFILALQYVTAGITSLAIALNPLIISVMSSIVLKRKVSSFEWLSIAIGIAGVAVAVYPLIAGDHVTFIGIGLLFLCMLTYSFGSVYYSSVEWSLSRLAINAWQVFLGGLMLAPFMVLLHEGQNHMDLNFWLSELWLIIPVSIVSVQLWLWLLKADPVKASLWLFLCPIFGQMVSTVLLDEPFTQMTAFGTALVLVSLYIGLKKKFKTTTAHR